MNNLCARSFRGIPASLPAQQCEQAEIAMPDKIHAR